VSPPAGSDLAGFYLETSFLFGSNLSKTNLHGASLSGANFYAANLSGATLLTAILSGANLSGASHAIVVAGYDDNKRIKNTLCDEETTGAFLIRNSWGTGWGENGYGWFPYEYILKGVTVDWWTIIKELWINLGQFEEGGSNISGPLPPNDWNHK